ncbi:MAG: hypothetical protein R6U52_05165 [Kosmotogaceae bacterium]
MKKLSVVIVLVFVLFLLSGCPWLFLKCLDFENLSLGFKYNVGDSFTESFTQVNVKEFYWFNGTPYSGGFAEVSSFGDAGHTGKEVWTNNVNLDFDFPSVLSSLELHYGYYGGNINVSINGVLKNEQDLYTLDGSTVSDVSISVSNPAQGTGVLTLQGTIKSFSIGGQEFVIDHICPKK